MKFSKYNIDFCDSNEKIIYNQISKKFIRISKEKYNKLIKCIKKGKFNESDSEYIRYLIKNNFVKVDEYLKINDYEKIKFMESEITKQFGTFFLTIDLTMNCNFNCEYCFERRENIIINDDVIEKILKLVYKKSLIHRRICIGWFGGEPTLEIEKIDIMSRKISEICKRNNSEFISFITTNGFLLTINNFIKLKNSHIKNIQITLDGYGSYNNKTRHLKDSSVDTFKKITKNIKDIISYGYDGQITLRINVNEENHRGISALLEYFDIKYRDKIQISISNIFQNKEKINLFELYKKALNLGYKINTGRGRVCEASMRYSICVYPDGQVSCCTIAAQEGFFFGKLNMDGDILLTNDNFFKFNNLLLSDCKDCSECNKRVFCMGGCKYARFKKEKCVYESNELSIDDCVKLEYMCKDKNKIIYIH